jgi:hypothetical protein
MPKQKMRCRSGLRYNEKAGTYDQCHGEHNTEEHDKPHPAQASAKQIILDEAGPWRDRHPLADTDLSVSEDEWNALAAEGHFPPCRPFHYDDDENDPAPAASAAEGHFPPCRPFHYYDDENDPAPAASPSVGTLFRNRKLRGTFRAQSDPAGDDAGTEVFDDKPAAAAPVGSFQDEIVLFAACVFLFLAATWTFSAIIIFATPTSVFVTPSFPFQTASLMPWSPITHTCAVGTCLSSMTILLSILLGGVVLCPSLLVTELTWLRFSVRVQTRLQEPAVPEAHPFTPIRPSATPTAPGASTASRYAAPTVFNDEEQSTTTATEHLCHRLPFVDYVLLSHSFAAVTGTSASEAQAPSLFVRR